MPNECMYPGCKGHRHLTEVTTCNRLNISSVVYRCPVSYRHIRKNNRCYLLTHLWRPFGQIACSYVALHLIDRIRSFTNGKSKSLNVWECYSLLKLRNIEDYFLQIFLKIRHVRNIDRPRMLLIVGSRFAPGQTFLPGND